MVVGLLPPEDPTMTNGSWPDPATFSESSARVLPCASSRSASVDDAELGVLRGIKHGVAGSTMEYAAVGQDHPVLVDRDGAVDVSESGFTFAESEPAAPAGCARARHGIMLPAHLRSPARIHRVVAAPREKRAFDMEVMP